MKKELHSAGFRISKNTATLLFGTAKSLIYREAKTRFGDDSSLGVHDAALLYQLMIDRYYGVEASLKDCQDFADLVLAALFCEEEMPPREHNEKPLLVVVSKFDLLHSFDCSDSTLQKWVRSGKLPKPMRPSQTPKVWSFSEIFETRYSLHHGGGKPAAALVNACQYRFLRWKLTKKPMSWGAEKKMSASDRAMIFGL